LNALEDQTLDRSRFEVVVGHDSRGPETAELVRTHPLAEAGVLRSVSLPPGSAPPGANRNAAWRMANAPVIAFTDDDCRPPADWLERALEAARRHPGAVVQGRTQPDPDEAHLLRFSHARTQRVEPPNHFAQACNIIYPKELLERLGGFDEVLETGEDADLAIRARKAGAEYVGAPEVLTWHAVAVPTLVGRLRSLPRWRHLPALIKRHPEHRRAYPLWTFWKPSHPFFPVALAAPLLARRNVLFILLALPWVVIQLPKSDGSPKSRYVAVAELPGRAVIDLAEYVVLAWGSLRNRTFFI
jgi:glycosyltransferase involved in cell wall biosynthesis